MTRSEKVEKHREYEKLKIAIKHAHQKTQHLKDCTAVGCVLGAKNTEELRKQLAIAEQEEQELLKSFQNFRKENATILQL